MSLSASHQEFSGPAVDASWKRLLEEYAAARPGADLTPLWTDLVVTATRAEHDQTEEEAEGYAPEPSERSDPEDVVVEVMNGVSDIVVRLCADVVLHGDESDPGALVREARRLNDRYCDLYDLVVTRHPNSGLGEDDDTGEADIRTVIGKGAAEVRNAEQAIGEIIDTEGAAKFEGYYNNAAADAERIRHGWYWTGDLGYLDEAGYLYFAGRAGDRIRVDGENISALLIERILRRHRRIVAAAVFAVPDVRSGDQVMAAVEIPAGTEFADLDLPEFLAGQPDLGTKDAPRFVRVSHALPTTGSGKLRKKEMRFTGWRTGDPVYRWTGRGAPDYAPMTGGDKAALREEFLAADRGRFLPQGADDAPART